MAFSRTAFERSQPALLTPGVAGKLLRNPKPPPFQLQVDIIVKTGKRLQPQQTEKAGILPIPASLLLKFYVQPAYCNTL